MVKFKSPLIIPNLEGLRSVILMPSHVSPLLIKYKTNFQNEEENDEFREALNILELEIEQRLVKLLRESLLR